MSAVITIEPLSQVTLEGAIDTIRSLPRYFYEVDFKNAEDNYTSFVDGKLGNSLFLVAREGKQVVAALGAIERENANGVYFLGSFAVRKGYRGQGIGRKILTFLEDELRSRGARLLYAETSTAQDFQETAGFYEAVGYELVAEVPDFWRKDEPLALYQKEL